MGNQMKSKLNEMVNKNAVEIKENEAMGLELSELRKVYDCRLDVDTLEFQPRAEHCLKRGGIFTIGDLAKRLGEINSIRGCGAGTVAEICEKLQDFINRYQPEPEVPAAGPRISRRPIGHCIIMQGNAPKYLICFGASSFDMGRATKTISLEGTEYSLAQYRIRVTHDGIPRLYINGEAMPAVLSRI